jgi:hypothetical protein
VQGNYWGEVCRDDELTWRDGDKREIIEKFGYLCEGGQGSWRNVGRRSEWVSEAVRCCVQFVLCCDLMEQSHSWDTVSLSSGQQIPHHLWNPLWEVDITLCIPSPDQKFEPGPFRSIIHNTAPAVKSLKPEIHVNNLWKVISYLAENTLLSLQTLSYAAEEHRHRLLLMQNT